MGTHYTFVVDHPLRMAQLQHALGPTHTFICTHGMLFDLPELRKGLGIDIAEGFKHNLCPLKGKEQQIREIANLRKDNLFVATAPTDEGYRLAHQVYILTKLNPKAKAHLILDSLASYALTNFLLLCQPLNLPALEAAEARRTLSRIGGCLLVQTLQRLNTQLSKPVIANIDYYGAVILSHLMGNLRESQPRQGIILRFPNGFEAQLIQRNPKDLSHPKPLETTRREDLRELAKHIATSKYPLSQISSDAQNTDVVFHFPTLASLAAQRLIQKGSLFELLNQLDTLYSQGFINSILSRGQLPRNVLWATLQKHIPELKLPTQPDPHFQCPKNALLIADMELNNRRLGDLQAFYTELLNANLLAALSPVSLVESYHLYQCGDYFFWGKRRFRTKGWPDHLQPALMDIFTPEPQEGSDYNVVLSSKGPDTLKTFLGSYSHQASLPYLLRSLHHLCYTFKYCHVEHEHIHLTDNGSQCADILWGLQDQISPYAHQINERGIMAIRQGKIDKRYLLNKWYTRFQPACEALNIQNQ